jgi:hypothetical protein
MEAYEPRVVAVALVTGGLSTSVVLARFAALGVPDGVSHRHLALLAITAAAVLVGLTGMILLAVHVGREARRGFRLTRSQLVAAGLGRPLVAVGGVVLVQRLLPWWRHELLSGAWQDSQARTGLLRWAPTEVVAVAALPMLYVFVLLSSRTWEARTRRPPVTTATVTTLSGIGQLYRSTWWVCATCERAFASESTCCGTSVWGHDEVAAAPTAKDWRVLVPPPRPVVSPSYDAVLDQRASAVSRDGRTVPDNERSDGATIRSLQDRVVDLGLG